MIFYKHFLGDYQAATAHLSLVEHGVYRQMLDSFYAIGRPLPANRSELCRLIRATDKAEKQAVDAISRQFWVPMPESFADLHELLECDKDEDRAKLASVVSTGWFDGGLVNARAIWEMIDFARRCESNRKVAIAREQKRRDAHLALVGGQQ